MWGSCEHTAALLHPCAAQGWFVHVEGLFLEGKAAWLFSWLHHHCSTRLLLHHPPSFLLVPVSS